MLVDNDEQQKALKYWHQMEHFSGHEKADKLTKC